MNLAHAVGTFLHPALNLMTPYPWPAHVEALLVDNWSNNLLPEVRRNLKYIRRVQPLRDTQITYSKTIARWLRFSLHEDRGVVVRGCAYGPLEDWFGGEVAALLPFETADPMEMVGDEPCFSSVMIREPVPKALMEPIRVWRLDNLDLIQDLIDVDWLIKGLMFQMERCFYPVAKLLYPSFDSVFPRDIPMLPVITKGMKRGEIKVRRREIATYHPIEPKFLARLVHPDDVEVVRRVFDQVAAGRLAGGQANLSDFNLYYDHSDYSDDV